MSLQFKHKEIWNLIKDSHWNSKDIEKSTKINTMRKPEHPVKAGQQQGQIFVLELTTYLSNAYRLIYFWSRHFFSLFCIAHAAKNEIVGALKAFIESRLHWTFFILIGTLLVDQLTSDYFNRPQSYKYLVVIHQKHYYLCSDMMYSSYNIFKLLCFHEWGRTRTCMQHEKRL